MNSFPEKPFIKKKSENQIEGDILFSWEYEPPRHKKIIYSLIPVIIISLWWASSFLLGRWGKSLSSVWMVMLAFFLGFAVRGFKSQKYRFTTLGVYIFDSSIKGWKRLGYWKEFIGYERGENHIKLIKKGLFGAKYIYFNKFVPSHEGSASSQDFLKILGIINENIFTHR